MGFSEAKLNELKKLIREEEVFELMESLTNFNEKTSPNYKLLYNAINDQKHDSKGDLISGYSGAILEGSSRSAKTWSWIFIVVWLCLIKHKGESIKINVYREHYADFKKTLFDDFKRVLDLFGLPNKFHRAERVDSFKIGDSTIHLLGCDKLKGSGHGSGSDYSIFNEMMFIDKKTYLQAVKRCRKFWIGDYNPSFTEHYVFDMVITRADVAFLRTTFLSNPYLSAKEKTEILITEPYLPNSYEVGEDDIYYNGEPVSDKNQPPPHPVNVEQGTADPFEWRVYGLGLRGAMTGVIITQLEWIKEFPNIAFTYANDFGFTNDPNACVKYAEDDKNIWFELLIYQPIDTPEELGAAFEANNIDLAAIIACDSSDKYTGENKGTVEMVSGLNDFGYDEAFKISKKKSVMYWLSSMRKKRLHCVKNDLWRHVKKEKENYKFKEVNGIAINQPIDKYNHIWDAVRYGHMSHADDYNIFY